MTVAQDSPPQHRVQQSANDATSAMSAQGAWDQKSMFFRRQVRLGCPTCAPRRRQDPQEHAHRGAAQFDRLKRKTTQIHIRTRALVL